MHCAKDIRWYVWRDLRHFHRGLFCCKIKRKIQVYCFFFFFTNPHTFPLVWIYSIWFFFRALLFSLLRVWVWFRHQSDVFSDCCQVCVCVYIKGVDAWQAHLPEDKGSVWLLSSTPRPWGLQSRADKLDRVSSPQHPESTDPFHYTSSREHLIRPLSSAWWWKKQSGLNIVGLMYWIR